MRQTPHFLALSLIAMLSACVAQPTLPVAERTGGMAWHFSGLDQLPLARDAAGARGSLVLVGLSGGDG